MEKDKYHLPLCVTCAHAWRAPQGYVRACALHLNDSTPLQMYGRCVEASVNDECDQYKPMEKATPKNK